MRLLVARGRERSVMREADRLGTGTPLTSAPVHEEKTRTEELVSWR
jgi:hypothetical protein